MKALLKKYKFHFTNKQFIISTAVAIVFLAVAITVTLITITYATQHASQPVTDIILSNTKVYDVDGIFLYGPLVFWAIVAGFLLAEPKKIPFTFKSLAIFLFIRSLFIIMTHVAPFPTHISLDSNGFFSLFNSGDDLFFSNHTGLPFLMALVFWDSKPMRYFCLASSVLFGIVVLLAHVHYTIDVFGAFFITYTIFHIAQYLFRREHVIFNHQLTY